MSLKERVLIINTLIIFIFKYAIQFLEISVQIQKNLQKEYF